MHAIASMQTSLIGLYDVAEPFVGDQALSEIGYGFELVVRLEILFNYHFNPLTQIQDELRRT